MSKDLRKFGFSLGLGLNILGFIMFYRHRGYFIWFSGTGSVVLLTTILYPDILAPLKKILDFVILSISLSISIISLVIAFYLIFTPIAILLRLFGRDLLNKKINKNAPSYWIKRKKNVFSKESYERMG
jgi:hypothetical protein